MKKTVKFLSKVVNPVKWAAENARLSEATGRFGNEQVVTDKAYLNINGNVMSVRLPY